MDAERRLPHPIFSGRRAPLSGNRAIEAHRIEPIAPRLYADRALRLAREELTQAPIRHASTARGPPLRRLELVAIFGIVEEVGEV